MNSEDTSRLMFLVILMLLGYIFFLGPIIDDARKNTPVCKDKGGELVKTDRGIECVKLQRL